MFRKQYFFWLNLLLLSLLSFKDASSKTIRLDEFQVLNLNTSQPMEPSGLAFKNGELYAVCDDTNAIFKISILDQENAEAVIDLNLDVTQLSAMNLDLEGLTVVDDSFFAVSEVHHKLISIKNNELSWVPELGGVYSEAFKDGLFQLYNAGMEAVTYIGDQTFLFSVERQPRGLIEVTFDTDFKTILKQTNQVFDDSKYPLVETRKPDLAGLFHHKGTIFALHRNAYIIHELIKDDQGVYQEGQAWSYEHIVKDPKYAYQNMQFGHAEGLAVDDDYFYLVLDNNNNPRFKKPNDKRPLLIKAKRPL